LPVTSLAHLTQKPKPLIITRSINKTMSLIQKFKKDVSTLRLAANGEIYLDVKNPKLYKKVRRFYENEGVVFSGDPLDDYEMLMEYIASDLETIEVA
jgi:exosome complex RNA-binding protein Rrp4